MNFVLPSRRGPRTKAQRLQELMRQSNSRQNKYSIGGVLKEGWRKPKPISLPVLNLDRKP